MPGFGELTSGWVARTRSTSLSGSSPQRAVDEALVVGHARAERRRLDGVGREVELDRHGQLDLHGPECRRTAYGVARGLPQEAAALVERQVRAAEVAGRRLDLGVVDIAHHRARLGDHLVVARQHHDRDAEGAGEPRVQRRLRHRLAVDAHVEEARDPRVRQDRVLVARLGVEADEQHRVEVALEALHLAPAPAQLPALEPHARQEVVGVDVAHVAVRVADDDLVRPAFDRAADDRVRVAGHEPPGATVAGQAAEDLLEPLNAARAFHVDRDEDLHRCASEIRVSLVGW